MNPPSGRTIGVLLGFTFLTSAAYVITSAIGMSLYLARIGSDALPLVLLASAIAVVAVSALTYASLSYASPRRCLFFVWFFLAAASGWLSWQLESSDHSLLVLGSIYVLAEIRGCVNTVYLTTLMTDAFRRSDSKRPYTLVASGAPLAGILAGILLGFDAVSIGNVRLLQLVSILDVAVMFLSWWLPQRNTEHASVDTMPHSQDPGVTDSQYPLQKFSRFRSYLTVLVIMKTVVLTLIGFQWKVTVSDYWLADEADMMVYFAIFYAVSDVLILLTQVSVAGRLLDRFGIGAALIGYPLVLAFVGIAALTTHQPLALMFLFTLARAMDVIRRSLHDPALTSVFTILGKRFRRQSIVVIRGIAKPVAEVATALLLFIYAAQWTNTYVTTLWWLLILPWLFAATAASTIHRRAENASIESSQASRSE